MNLFKSRRVYKIVFEKLRFLDFPYIYFVNQYFIVNFNECFTSSVSLDFYIEIENETKIRSQTKSFGFWY